MLSSKLQKFLMMMMIAFDMNDIHCSFIFSRKDWSYAMKTKSLSDTTPAIKKVFISSGLHEFKSKALVIIMSDSDAAFRHNAREEDQNFKKH
jgi:hypothetical protein